ncbi:MAG: lactonase family protein [Anaerolineales bacterium]|nr:lactonase family protein [Anaerolineales bacterium]
MSGFYIGTYSQKLGNMQADGEGIYHCQIDLDSGEFSTPECVAACINPSYLAWGAGRRHLYATREVFQADEPALLGFALGKGAALEPMNSVAVEGELPCHLCVDISGKYLACAQYLSGNVMLYQLQPDGSIGELLHVIQHQGSSADPRRQEAPHAHFVQFLCNPDELAVVDLGIDQVITYAFDTNSGGLDIANPNSIPLAAGAGPRHFVNHAGSRFFYVYSELNATIFLFEHLARNWVQKGEYSLETSSGAAIRMSPDGKYLYVSERSNSEIVSFSVDQNTGALSPLQRISTGGESPRDFDLTPDGSFVVVANQISNTLTSLVRDPDTGLLRNTGQTINLGSPVCVLF